MKSGYDQFFKQAKENSTKPKKGKRAKSVKARARRIAQSAKAKQPTEAELAIREALGLKEVEKPRKSPARISTIVGILAVMAGVSLMGWLAIEPWHLDELMDVVEIGVFGEVKAASSKSKKSEKNSSKKNGKEANSSSEKSRDPNSVNESVTQDFSYYAKLNDKRKELDLREKELNELEGELHKQRLEIEARIQHLEKLRDTIAGVLRDKVEVDQKKVKRLVDFYSNMKPQQAAKIIGTLNEDLAIEVLGQMKKKSAAAIMNLLEPGKAQVLSEKFAGYKRR